MGTEMTPPTPAELAAWKAATDAATTGPWVPMNDPARSWDRTMLVVTANPKAGLILVETHHDAAALLDDAKFIALARSALPRLLAAYKAALAEAERLRSVVEAADKAAWIWHDQRGKVGDLASAMNYLVDVVVAEGITPAHPALTITDGDEEL